MVERVGPGVYDDMPAPVYHAHPALSASGAKLLLDPSCPALYRYAADHPPVPKKEFDFGHAVHGLVLGTGGPVVVVEARNWQTKAAKEQKAKAHAAGHIPVLAHDWVRAQEMAAALRRHPIAAPLFEPGTGRAELSMFWHDDEFGIDRRGRIDWLKGRLLVDFKTCRSAHPTACAKAMWDYSYNMQLDTYLTGAVETGLHDDPAGLIVWQEVNPPYLVTVTDPIPEALAAGRDRNRKAMDVFARCVAADSWPGYANPGVAGGSTDDSIVPLGLPRWAEIQHDAAVDRGDYHTEADLP